MGFLSPLLATTNMKETIEFYTNTLGFRIGMVFPSVDNPEYVDFSKDGMVLMFIPAGNMGIGAGKKLGTGVDMHMQIDGDIDEYYRELRGKGVEIAGEIKDEPYGIRDFAVADPNGYRLTFNQVSNRAKTCMSCGMPMTKPEDFGGGDMANLSCIHCSEPDGSLKTYDEVLQGMIEFIMSSQKLNKESAERAAKEHMAKMLAWSDRI